MNEKISIEKTIMHTPWQQKVMPHLIRVLTEENGATYDEIKKNYEMK